jgi:CheY-like chemotaxis protein
MSIDGGEMAQILVVEDDYLTLQLLYYFLRRNNHTILQACNGYDAIDVLRENQVDLVITDLNMPGMDGLALLEYIRSNEQTRDVPVIVLTASGVEQIRQLTLDKGATAFVNQPFSSVELSRIVSESLS